jgi:fumarylacetoacetase
MTLSAAGYGPANLPLGVARLLDGSTAVVTRLGDSVVLLGSLAEDDLLPAAGLDPSVLADGSLNRLLAAGRPVWSGVRRAVADLARQEHPGLVKASVGLEEVELLAPVAVGDFVDFSASIHHAANVGRLFRPGADPLRPGWTRMPFGYSGRASSVVASGTPVTRPYAQAPGPDGDAVVGPTAALDFEAEVGFVVAATTAPGERLATAAFADAVAGVVLVNDWSARDVQAHESHPLGPFLAKSFATSVSPWLVTLDALDPYRVDGPPQEPPPPAYLAASGNWAYDLRLEVELQTEGMRAAGIPPAVISRSYFASMYWTGPQLLAHATVNGAPVRAGDVIGSGTVSGPDAGSQGCLLELTEGGSRPLRLPDGTTRGYLEDGDTLVVRAWAGGDRRPLICLGEVAGTVAPARPLEV